MNRMVSELYDALRKAGVDEQLSKEAARAVLAADSMKDLATKSDIAEFSGATTAELTVMRSDIAEFRAATKADLAAMKTDIAELRSDVAIFKATTRADIADLKTELIKWNVGAMAILTAIFAAISRLG